jgi:hypothetical protein
MLVVVGETERIQGSFLGLEDIFEDFLFAHSHVVVGGSYFFPIG